MSAAVCQVRNLHVSAVHRNRHTLLLRDVSMQIAPGEVHAIVGESGAGKSMMVRTMLGVTPPNIRVQAGSIELLGHDWLALPEPRKRQHLGREIALIPQDPLTALNPALTVGRQLGDLLTLHLGLSGVQRQSAVDDWLVAVRIRNPSSVARQYPHELSGGMRQRVLIAMAFCCGPRLILADEPTTALDVTVQREILMLLRRLQREHGTAIGFVTHNLGIVAKLCDNATVLHSGMVVEQASVARLFSQPASDYTRALLAATPRHDQPADHLQPVSDALVAQLQADARAFDRHFASEHGIRLEAGA